MCNIYRGIQNTTYYVQHLSRNSKYNLLCVTFIVEYIVNTIYNLLCVTYRGNNFYRVKYRGIQNTTYYV